MHWLAMELQRLIAAVTLWEEKGWPSSGWAAGLLGHHSLTGNITRDIRTLQREQLSHQSQPALSWAVFSTGEASQVLLF